MIILVFEICVCKIILISGIRYDLKMCSHIFIWGSGGENLMIESDIKMFAMTINIIISG